MKEELIDFLVKKELLRSSDLDTDFNLLLTRDCYVESTKRLINELVYFIDNAIERKIPNVPKDELFNGEVT